MFLLVEAQLLAVDELLATARHLAGELRVAVFRPPVVLHRIPLFRRVGTPGLGALDDDSQVYGPLVAPETTARHELQTTVGLRAQQLGSAVLRPFVIAQQVPLCRRVVTARSAALESEALVLSPVVEETRT